MRQTAGCPQNGMRDPSRPSRLAARFHGGPPRPCRPFATARDRTEFQESTRSGTMSFFNARRILVAATAAVALVSVVQAADISGAGATFPTPIYSKWADAYKKQTGVGLNYQSIGSGGGIKQIKAKTVTFGASDMPL